MQFLQEYWWFLISLLGALLVMLLFVQGGQTFIYTLGGKDEKNKRILLNTFGRKWEFTFTTLVTFGGAFFASFPRFYSVSFGGAVYLWTAILLAMVIQAVSYEYRSKENNFLGKGTYDLFLTINGIVAPFLLGVAVGTLFFGADFTFVPSRILNKPSNYAISAWNSSWHGLEALADPRNVLLGLAVLFLARVLGLLYIINAVDDQNLVAKSRKALLWNSPLFLVFFLAFLYFMLTADGVKGLYRVTNTAISYGYVVSREHIFLTNFMEMPCVAAVFGAGVLSVLIGILKGAFMKKSTGGIWYGAVGTVMVVLSLFLVAGMNGVSFYRSLSHPGSSLTVSNSCSSMETLTVMTYVSLLIPFVLAYIWWAWRSLNKRKVSKEEIETSAEIY